MPVEVGSEQSAAAARLSVLLPAVLRDWRGFSLIGGVGCPTGWERDQRVRVVRRDLNYRGWPDIPPREKGVDVALAIDLVESALLGQYDVAVVFSCDSDLLPAMKYLPYCHFLNADDFNAVRDRTDYLGRS